MLSANGASAAQTPVGLGAADDFTVLQDQTGTPAAAGSAAAEGATAGAGEPAPDEPPVEELQDAAQQLTDDFTPPTVHIRGKRRVRAPRVVRLRVVARDNKRVSDLEVTVDGTPRYRTPPLNAQRRKLVLRLHFRSGRHKIVAYAVDGATTGSRLARATVVVR